MEMRRHFFRPLLVGGAVGLLAALIFMSGALESWSNLATDRLFLDRPSDPSIVVVAIDDASLGQIGRWPWDRSIHAKLITKITAAGASAIGYDVNFPEASNPEDDAALEMALKSSGRVVLPVELSLRKNRRVLTYDPGDVVAPLPVLSVAARYTGHANAPPDADGVVRRIPLSVPAPDGSSVPAFALQMLRLVQPDYAPRSAPQDKWGRVLINFNGPPRANFTTVPATDVLRDNFDPAVFQGKAVFVGATAPDLHDDRLVPTSFGTPMAGVELHASFYDTLLTGRWLSPMRKIVQALLITLLGVLAALAIVLLRARYSPPLILTLWVGVVVTAFALFDRGKILDLVWPTLALIFSTAAVTLERRITSDRERHRLRSAFSRYVSESVVKSILSDPAKLKLGGEKRRMSVLFSDVRNFTALSESLSAEQLVEIMNTYLTRMTEVVFRHEGVLDKYIGDAVMAFWNAPLDQEDHAFRAVSTALDMQRELDQMNKSGVFLGGRLQLRIGIGVNTGEMIVGNMGSHTRFDYTVIGDNVNLASRLEGITKEYGVGILATEATYKEVMGEVVARRVDKVAVKGKKESVVVYEVINLAKSATEAERRLAGDFDVAFASYLNKDFETAANACENILKDHPDDGPAKVLLERARAFLAQAPSPDWDGTWVMTKK